MGIGPALLLFIRPEMRPKCAVGPNAVIICCHVKLLGPRVLKKQGGNPIEVLQEAGAQNVRFYCLAPMATL